MLMQKTFIAVAISLISIVANAEDCLDRQDDRNGREYYSDRYDDYKERRRHSNDDCNEAFEERQKVKAEKAELEQAKELKKLEQARAEERAREEKARIENEATAKRLLQLMKQ